MARSQAKTKGRATRQVFPSPIPGLGQLPDGSNCDWCGDSVIQLNKITRFKPNHSWPNYFFWVNFLWSMQGTNAQLGQNLGTDVISPELAACLAKKNLPIGLYSGARISTEWALGEGLARLGLKGVAEAEPLALTGTFIGSAIGCAKELTPGVGPK